LQKNSWGEVMESGGTRGELAGRFLIIDFLKLCKHLY
jgi:hypothetical protein